MVEVVPAVDGGPPPDYAPYADKPGWWLGEPRNGDNGDAGGEGGAGPVINGDNVWEKEDYPLGAFQEKDVEEVLKSDKFENPIYVKVKTGADGVASVRFKVTDHVGGDNYYVIASFHPIKLPDKYDYRSLRLGKQRTGCLTAWKRVLFWQYGMETAQNSGKHLQVPAKGIAEVYKDAYVEFAQERYRRLKYSAPREFKDLRDLEDFADEISGKDEVIFQPNHVALFVLPDVDWEKPRPGQPETMGVNVRPGPHPYAFVFYNRHIENGKPDEQQLVVTCAHELCHSFDFAGDPNGPKKIERDIANYFGFGVSEQEDKSPMEHDKNPAWKNHGAKCVMHWKDSSCVFCLKHIEALRRARYDFFRKWREEADRKKK